MHNRMKQDEGRSAEEISKALGDCFSGYELLKAFKDHNPRKDIGPNATIDEKLHYIDVKGPYEYSIPLCECETPAHVLNWIFQIKAKTWATPEIVYDLLTAFDVACQIYHGNTVQGCLCPGGGPSSVRFSK